MSPDERPKTPKEDKAGIELPFSSDWKPLGEIPIPPVPPPPAVASAPPSAPSPAPDIPEAPPAPARPPLADAASPQEAKPGKSVKICPKCGRRQDGFFSCDRCGLIFANWRPGLEQDDMKSIPKAVLDQAAALWRDAESATEGREEKLQAFHDFCLSRNAMTVAAVRYRSRLAAHPDDAAVKTRQQRLISQTVLMLPNRERRGKKDPEPVSRRAIVLVVITGLVLALLAGWATTLLIGSP